MSRAAGRAVLTLVGVLASAAGLAGVGTWTQVGPIGPTQFVAVDPGNPDLVYTEKFRSLDGGATWVPDNLGAVSSSQSLLAVGPTRNVYVAGVSAQDGHEALFLSEDAATSWVEIYSPPQSPYTSTWLGGLVVDPITPSVLYMSAAQQGMFRGQFFQKSVDGGHTWTTLAVPGDERSGVTSAVPDPSTTGTLYISVTGYIGLHQGTYKSTDGGASWLRLATPGNDVLAIDPQNPSTVYAANRYGNGPLMKSTDGGATFASTGAQLGEAVQLIVSPTSSHHLIALGHTVLESTDGGATFIAISGGLPQPHSIAIDSAGSVLFAATDSGVYSYQFNPGELHLNAAHPFSITLAATDQRTGRFGAGVATQVNDLWGYFSIPAITNNPNNPEVFVKMLDGTALNGSYWFFYGGLTDLEYTLTVAEDVTGKQKTYTKPAGSECGGSDTAAFGP